MLFEYQVVIKIIEGIEHRVSGVDANPYLVALTIISAIELGIQNKISPDKQTTGNAYLKKNNQKYKIPSDWNSSIMLSKKSSFLKQTLGPELHKAFIAIKEMEYHKFASTISELDIDLYLDAIEKELIFLGRLIVHLQKWI